MHYYFYAYNYLHKLLISILYFDHSHVARSLHKIECGFITRLSYNICILYIVISLHINTIDNCLYVTVWAKNRHVCTQTEIHFIAPDYIATLNNYTCSLPPLAKVDWSAFPECFFRPCISMTGEMVPKEGSNLAVGTWYGSHCQCTSV